LDELEEVPYRDIDLNELSIQALIRSEKPASFISSSPKISLPESLFCVSSVLMRVASRRKLQRRDYFP
jgi:hypothetical protein